MSDKKKGAAKSLLSAGGVILVLLILVLVNALFTRVNMRWDATRDHLYSLSDSTIAILANLEQDVTLKVFYSRDTTNLPLSMKNYAKQVLDFLSEYEYAGKGRLRLEFYDPRVDSEEEEWAQKYGIQGLSLPSGETVYFGLVALAADQEETLAYLDPARESYLEYDLTRIVARIQSPVKLKISVISDLPLFGSAMPRGMPGQPPDQPPWLIIEELEKTYDVKEVRPSATRFDADSDLVLLIYPKGISEQLQYAVDQYVLAGGNVIAYVDPLSLIDSGTGQPGAASLERLFKSWGVSMDVEQILVDMDNPTRLAGPNNQVEIHPVWISLSGDAFSTENIVTAKLESMLLPATGAFKKEEKAGVDYLPLIRSSANSSMVNRMMAQVGPEFLRKGFKPQGIHFDLAVMLRGTFNTAFADGPPKEPTSGETAPVEDGEAAHLASGRKAAAMILVADTDLLFDRFYVNRQNFLGMNITQIFNDNLNFLLNAVEMLTGSSALIDIRSRGEFERPFTRVQALEKKAQARWLTREQELVVKVEETNRKLMELEKGKDASQKFVLSEAQEQEIEKFKAEKLQISKELKVVRRNLRAEIESLGTRLKFFNIFGVPLLVAFGGILYAYLRRRRRLRHAD